MCSSILFTVAIFVTRPAFMWMIQRNPDGEPLKENYIIALLLCVCVTGICGHAMGLHIYYGPLILGIILPAGPPVGTTAIDNESFTVLCVFMVLVTSGVTPVIRALYDPSRSGVESAKNSIKITNQNVLDKAPCSVAILVDRGLLKIPRSILESWYEYRIAVLFLGGSDDHEALAIGGRMAGHPSVHLTVIRLLDNGDARKTRLDNKVMNMFRRSMENNYRVTYKEEMVMDGTGTVSVIRSLESQYELIMGSPFGIAIWDEHMELGAVGDVLASVDFMSSTTILVVQQHNNVYTENQMKHGIL
ncbi:hypothetical protein LWI28_019865 [Acer negundo]|uniref:Cation/H(+) antiporter C-terminal domain-containing protein n=1 Tax=Acer negundo TaxID=4023 RepID=A0AAD5IUZ0_ACENE|nr:hypothetical protein LWI28_019865 [Acer negundo]